MIFVIQLNNLIMTFRKKILAAGILLLPLISIRAYSQVQKVENAAEPPEVAQPEIEAAPQEESNPLQTKITDDELKTFATLYPKVQEANLQAQDQMATLITENGIEVQRYMEIQQAQASGEEMELSPEEAEKVEQIKTALQEVQPKLEEGLEKIITDGGLSMERFQSIAMAIQTDPSLQSKLQELMK